MSKPETATLEEGEEIKVGGHTIKFAKAGVHRENSDRPVKTATLEITKGTRSTAKK